MPIVEQPPKAGPEIAPTEINMEIIAKAVPRFSGVEYSVVSPIEFAMIMAEPIAWTIRPNKRTVKLGDRPLR